MNLVRRIMIPAASLVLLAGAATAANASAEQESSVDETASWANLTCSPTQTAITDVPHRLFDAWNRGDAAGVAAQFTTDGHMIPSNGSYLTSRTAIANFYQGAFAGPLKEPE